MLWSGRRGSNPQPTAWEAATLPLSYSRSILGIIPLPLWPLEGTLNRFRCPKTDSPAAMPANEKGELFSLPLLPFVALAIYLSAEMVPAALCRCLGEGQHPSAYFCSRLAKSGASLKVIQEAAATRLAPYAHMDHTTLQNVMAILNHRSSATSPSSSRS